MFWDFMIFKVTAGLLKFEICGNLFLHSKLIFTSVHTFVFISLASLREPAEVSKLQVSQNPQRGGCLLPGRGRSQMLVRGGQVGLSTRQHQVWKGSVLLLKYLFCFLFCFSSNALILFIKPRESQTYGIPPGQKIRAIQPALSWASGVREPSGTPGGQSTCGLALTQPITRLRSGPRRVIPCYCCKFCLHEIFQVRMYSPP